MDAYSLPYIVTNLFAVIMVILAIKYQNLTRGIWGLVFMGAALVNFFLVLQHAELYVNACGRTAIPLYKEFIYGFFSHYTQAVVYLIATGQMIAGFLLLNKGIWFKIGSLGAIIFLLAVAPLKSGSAFPATIIMAISIFIVFYRGISTTILETKLLHPPQK